MPKKKTGNLRGRRYGFCVIDSITNLTLDEFRSYHQTIRWARAHAKTLNRDMLIASRGIPRYKISPEGSTSVLENLKVKKQTQEV